ncbi:MAG: DNA repair protein RecN [Pseudomonadota bacterium]
MLTGLDIRDMLIIDRLELEFQAGLNVLTGETGAGKSILLDALGFVLGWRGRADLVRQGATDGEVTAVFELGEGHPARAVLEHAGLPVEDELILRRVNTAEGRKTAWVNDRRVSGEVLRALSDTLVELHGQHDDRGLLNPSGHRELLDAFGGYSGKIEAVRAAWAERRQADAALADARAGLEALRAEEEFLRHAVGELDDLAPEPGEDAALDAQRRLMQAADRIREDVIRAHGALGGQGAEAMLSDAMRWVQGAAGSAEGRLDGPIAALSQALDALGEAEQGVAEALAALDHDPAELERVEERLFAIRALARKHDVLTDDLSGFAETLRDRLTRLDAGAGDLDRLRQDADEAELRYAEGSARLTAARQAAATRLDAAMAAELAPLKMERAVFTTLLEPTEPGPTGVDAVSFQVATNPGAPAGALNKIASGGELSRFLLALKVCLTSGEAGKTLIFDEIDRGVGGATADAVGRRLADLSDQAQVLVVTHSPQVAALGRHHWRVEKDIQSGVTLSRVVPLDAPARIDEIARMLSGEAITDEARGAARALLAG